MQGGDQLDTACRGEWDLAEVPNTLWRCPNERSQHTFALNEIIADMEKEVNQACKTTLDSLVGKVIGW
jgi:hypothetical protein